MTRRQTLYIFYAALALSILIFLTGIIIRFDNKTNMDVRAISEQSSVPYVLREYNGNIAYFRGDSSEPYFRTDFAVANLNEYDRKLVREGIMVESESELRRLSEDLTG